MYKFLQVNLDERERDSSSELPERPAYAKDGEKISILTNFIKVQFTDTDVFQYHIVYDPPVDSKFLRYFYFKVFFKV